jgi:uncharacterized lipoprotein YmbA
VSLRIIAGLSLLCAAALQGACTTTPRASFYTLNAVPVEAPAAPSGLTIALGPIDLPEYLDRPQIVTREGDNRLRVDDFNRWGGSLEEEMTRVLARHLGQRLGTQRVYGYPSRIAADTDYRIALDVRRFDGPLDGEVTLEVAWSVIDDRSSEPLDTQQSLYRISAAGADYAAYAAALSTALARLGDDLASVVSALRVASPR